MGYTVLYIAFGIVALWLLGEVLLQDKARLRWRVLAFAGFLGVAVGAVLSQVVVIVLGVAAFGVGQAFVTLSHRRGFSTGWVLGGRPNSSRRRKGGGTAQPAAVTTVRDAEARPAIDAVPAYDAGQRGYLAQPPDEFGQQTPAYSPELQYEGTGEYGIHGDHGFYASASYTSGEYESYGAQGQQYGNEWQPQPDWQNTADLNTADLTSYQDPFQRQELLASGHQQQPYQEQQSWADYQQEQYQGFDAHQQPQGYAYEPYAEPYAEQHTQAYGHGTLHAGLWPSQPDPGEPPYIPQQAPPTHDEPQPQHFDPYEPYRS
jgi:hypothetical protein